MHVLFAHDFMICASGATKKKQTVLRPSFFYAKKFCVADYVGQIGVICLMCKMVD